MKKVEVRVMERVWREKWCDNSCYGCEEDGEVKRVVREGDVIVKVVLCKWCSESLDRERGVR